MNQQAERYLREVWSGPFMSPAIRGRIRKSLERTMTLNNAAVKSRADHSIDLVAAGYRVVIAKNGSRRVTATNGSFFEEKDLTTTMVDFISWLRTISAREAA